MLSKNMTLPTAAAFRRLSSPLSPLIKCSDSARTPYTVGSQFMQTSSICHYPASSKASALTNPVLRSNQGSVNPSSSTLSRANHSMSQSQRCLNIDNIRHQVRRAQYAVRGELAVKAEEYRIRLESGDKSLPFESVISANIGNPQQLDQKPITFFRQVLSILEYPPLLENEEALRSSFGYKQDVIDRARILLKNVQTVGAYSHSQGVPLIRQSIANFIEMRDGFPSDPNDIFVCGGASSGVNTMLNVICANSRSGVLTPIPQYPLYTATLSLLDATCVPYYLDESKAWGTNIEGIRTSLRNAKDIGTDVRAIVVINPGNPTGASLSKEDITNVLGIAAEEKLVVIADEVYQTNVFVGEFISFKKQLRTLQQQYPGKYDNVELVSLHSVSKGMVGECGHRGGYFELVNLDHQVAEQVYKFVSIQLCPPVIGQCLVELMVNPPKKGDPSFELYNKEYNEIKDGLEQRARALHRAFESMEGVDCQEPQGSMYLFPTITLPPKAIAAAKAADRQPDEFYSLRLLDATGICVVPGSGFGQREGTLHFRTTFLAPGTQWIDRISNFHQEFMDEFR